MWVNEHAAGILPKMPVVFAIIDQHVARLHMLVLLARHRGDDRHSREMLGGPALLLLGRPLAER